MPQGYHHWHPHRSVCLTACRLLKRKLTLRERCQIALQAALGMSYLHDQNPAVIHFDLKPDNLLVEGEIGGSVPSGMAPGTAAAEAATVAPLIKVRAASLAVDCDCCAELRVHHYEHALRAAWRSSHQCRRCSGQSARALSLLTP